MNTRDEFFALVVGDDDGPIIFVLDPADHAQLDGLKDLFTPQTDTTLLATLGQLVGAL